VGAVLQQRAEINTQPKYSTVIVLEKREIFALNREKGLKINILQADLLRVLLTVLLRLVFSSVFKKSQKNYVIYVLGLY
jgi:hypothetical protein